MINDTLCGIKHLDLLRMMIKFVTNVMILLFTCTEMSRITFYSISLEMHYCQNTSDDYGMLTSFTIRTVSRLLIILR